MIEGSKKGFLIVLLALLPVIMVLGQSPVDKLSREAQRDYRDIRSHVRNTPKSIETDVDALASYLQEGMNTDLEKVRSLYLWVAYNVTYDMKAFMRGRLGEQTVPDVLQKRKAVCEGYANLFSALCERAGLENRKIIGYSKGYGYEAGQKFAVSNHAWNAVRLDEEWFLLDVTWAASRSNASDFGPSENNLERYFLTQPHIFLIDHLPEDPEWQLIESPISLDDFEAGKNVPAGQKKKKVKITGDTYSREVAHYERVVRHNPGSQEAQFRLGYAYLSKALDTLEVIHDLRTDSIFLQLEQMEPRLYHFLDEAAERFSGLRTSYSNFDKAQSLLEECTYQKGVFHYEAGFQILSLLVDMDKQTYFTNAEKYTEEVNLHWDIAIDHFKKVPDSSLYHEQARQYIDHYIPEYRP